MVKTHTTAGIAALLSGDYEAAARHLERAHAMARGPVGWSTFGYSTLYLDYATLLGCARLKLGDRDRALRLFEETAQHYTEHIARGDTSFRARVGMAAVHALRGDREEAYRWLQQAIDAGFYPYAELERHPCFESLRGGALPADDGRSARTGRRDASPRRRCRRGLRRSRTSGVSR